MSRKIWKEQSQLRTGISYLFKSLKKMKKKRGGDHPRKTIVFAITKKHAAQLARFFNELYLEYKGKYAEIITTDTFDPQRAIKRFKKNPYR